MQTVYIIATTSINEKQNVTEFSISQEAYSSLEKAQAFCSSRYNVYQVDDLTFEQMEENDNGWIYNYQIIPVYVK